MKALVNTYSLPIGDWSGDGHSKCDYFDFESNVKLQELFDAYHLAKEKLSEEIWPENLCSHYEESIVQKAVVQEMLNAGYNFPKDWEPYDGDDDMNPDTKAFAHYVLWFIMQGNKNIKLKLIENNKEFIYWNDKKKRDIGHLGYGLFT